ncbi:MAG TPA: chromosomal replication initiator protein DnaA [Porphyromonadaceae bacterium]|nr:chromosomal replication initiator protein DnaA [Porphyromonadaceae bacterium]
MQCNIENLQSLWVKWMSFVRDNVTEAVFSTWFEPMKPLSYKEDVLTVQVPSHFFCEFLENKFSGIIGEGISKVFGIGTRLKYYTVVVSEDSTGFSLDSSEPIPNHVPKGGKIVLPTSIDPFSRHIEEDLEPQLNPSYTFHNLVEGNSNKLARTAGETVATRPGDNPFNPLFIHGPSGIGKTHLLHAIGLKIKDNDPRMRVLYISAHLFKVQFSDANLNHKVNDFIHFYQSIDTLLIDDIQELVGKEKTQNAFFHIFNHLHQSGKQLVMSCDKAPADLEGMEDRLITRFKWGLTAEMEYPDLEMRKDILRHRISKDGLIVGEDLVEYLAEKVTGSARELEGTLVSLLAHSTIYNHKIDMELARRVLEKRGSYKAKEITPSFIEEKVSSYYKVSPEEIQSKGRKKDVANARQVSMYLVKKHTKLTYQAIGKYFGKRNHATVLHAYKAVIEQLPINKTLRNEIMELEDSLKV